MIKTHSEELQATEMKYWYRSCGVTELDRVQNKRRLATVKEEYNVTGAVAEKQLDNVAWTFMING